jgi:cell division protein FtsB
MKSFQKKERFKQIMQSKIFLVFLGIVILTFFFSMFSLMRKMEDTRNNRKIIENKIAELEKSKAEFNSEITKLKTEAGVEESIREKFGLAKEGENMIMIVDDKKTQKTEPEVNSLGLWVFLKNLFK